MCRNEKGFSTPLLLLIALALLAVPAYYWSKTNSVNLTSNSSEVMGVKDIVPEAERPGFRVSIMASTQKWDLLQYLCKSKDECLASLESGHRLGTVSGGKTNLHQVVVNYSSSWDDYDYLKYFVRSGWGSGATAFNVDDKGEIPGSEIETIEDSGLKYEIILTPLKPIKDTFYESAVFSDL